MLSAGDRRAPGELTLIRSARALAALEGHDAANMNHLKHVALFVLRHRLRRDPMDESSADARVERTIAAVLPELEVSSLWRDAQLAAAVIAVTGHQCGGVRVSAQPGPVRDFWLSMLEELQQAHSRKIPANTPTDRLLGGMDITESMRLGKPVLATGVLSECHQRTVVMPMAERLPKEYSGHWCAALDSGKVHVARDGLTHTTDAAITLIALDEGIDEEAPPAALLERLAFNIQLDPISIHGVDDTAFNSSDINRVKDQLRLRPANESIIKLLAELAASMGVHSTRSLLFSLTACRAIALLLDLPETHEEVIGSVIRLVLLPRATQLPQQEAPEPPVEEQEPETTDENALQNQTPEPPRDTEEMVQAAVATLPPTYLPCCLAVRNEVVNGKTSRVMRATYHKINSAVGLLAYAAAISNADIASIYPRP